MTKSIALLHYAGPPIVGGVESVMRQHASLLRDGGHRVRIIAGRGETVDPQIPFFPVPLVDSLHPDILAAKQQLDSGSVPEDFEALCERVEVSLREALQGVEVLFIHNVCTMNKNLPLTAALRRIGASSDCPRLVAWHHDLAWNADRYRSEMHEGWPWSLVGEVWPEVPMTHVVVSETRRKEVCDVLGMEPASIHVVPSGMDTNQFYKFESFTEEILEKLPLLEADPLLLLPVRITRRKNIEQALRITAALGKYMPKAMLIVTGPPGAHNTTNQTYFEELIALRAELGLDPATHDDSACPKAYFLAESFQGFLPDEVIADLYRITDALLIPSFDEGFGIPLIEAGLSRIPIYCSDIGPFREIARDFATYFSPQDDPNSIAEKIARYFESNHPHALRQRVRSTYSWNALYKNKISPLLEDS